MKEYRPQRRYGSSFKDPVAGCGWYSIIIFWFFFLGVGLSPNFVYAEEVSNSAEYNVLLLSSSDLVDDSEDDSIAQIALELKENNPDIHLTRVEVSSADILQESSGFGHLKSLLSNYPLGHFDLIIARGAGALRAIHVLSAVAFGGSPLVYYDVGTAITREYPNSTGILNSRFVGENIDLILKLFPATAYIAVITDASYSGREARYTAKSIFRHDNRVSAVYINGSELTEEQIVSAIGRLPKNSCILLDSCFIGARGKSFDSGLLQQIIHNPFCPVFSAKKKFIREGALGGVTYDAGDLRRVLCGLLVPDLLGGKIKASDINIDMQSSNIIINPQALKQYKVDFSSLPQNTVYDNGAGRSPTVAAAKLNLLDVVYDSAPPLVWKNSEGKLQGALVDIWDLWARENNVSIKFIRNSGNIENIPEKENILRSDIGVSEVSDGNMSQVDFAAAIPFMVTDAAVYQSSEIPVNSGWEGYEGKRIALVKNDSFRKFLLAQIPDVTLVIYENNELLFSDLDSGKFTAFFMEDIVAQTMLGRTGRDTLAIRNDFCTVRVRVLPRIRLKGDEKNSAEINRIYHTLNKIPFESKCSIINRYNDTAAEIYPIFSEEEVRWLHSGREVVVGCTVDMELLQNLEHEHITGIIPDILRRVFTAARIKYSFVSLKGNKTEAELLRTGKVDLLSYASGQNSSDLLYSRPYLRESAVAVTWDHQSYIGDNKSIIAIPKYYMRYYYYFKNSYPGNSLLLVESVNEAIKLVEEKVVDIAFMSRLDVAWYASKLLNSNMHISVLYSMPLNFTAVVADNPSGRILRDILNKGIITISKKTIESIIKENENRARVAPGIRDIILFAGPWILGLIIIILALWGYITRMALRRLHKSEADLQNEKAWLNAMMHSIGEGVIATDVSGCIVQLNFTAERILQCKEYEVVGLPAAELCVLFDTVMEKQISDPLVTALEEIRVVELQHNIVLRNQAKAEIPITAVIAPIIDTVRDKVLGAVLVFRDIRAENSYRKEINQTRKMLSNAIELAGVSYFVYEVRTGKVIINMGRKETYLYVEDELNLADIFPDIVESDLKNIREQWDSMFAHNIHHFHTNYTSKYKRRVRFNRVEVRSEVNADADIIRVFGVRLDVTDVVKAENVSRERLEQAYDLAKLLYYEYHPLTNTITVSPQLKKIFMLDDDLSGTVLPLSEVFKYVVAGDKNKIAEDFIHIKNSRLDKLEEELHIERKTERKIVKLFVDNKFSEDGEWIGSSGCILDITELNYVQKELEVSEEQKRLILGSIKEGVVYINRELEILWANESTYAIFECRELNPLSEPYNYIVYGESKPSMLANTVGIMRGISFELVESLAYRGKDLLVSLNPIRNASGEVTHLVKTFSDVSEFKEIQKNLREAYERAETANKAKSTFLSTMTHEIRTPLNAIIGFSGLLQYEELDLKSASYANSIHAAASGLLSLINNVLDFSRIEANKLTLSLLPMNLGELLDEMKAIFETRAISKNLQLKFLPYEQIPPLVLDKDRLRQVLLNILGNAIKFTNKGKVEVNVKFRRYAGKSLGSLQIVVADTGIGIPLKDQSRMFESFEQHENSTTRRYEGTGLGLSISKRLVELMNGSIKLKSEVGKGSEFIIIFENVECITEMTIVKNMPLQGITRYTEGRVLLISNNQNDLTIVASMLKKMELEVSTTSFVGDAFELLDEEKFDLIITSVVVPEADNDVMNERLITKAREKGISLVALTGYSDPGEFFDITQYDTVIVKPVTVETFSRIIGGFFADSMKITSEMADADIVRAYSVSGLNPDIIRQVLEKFEDSFSLMLHGVVIDEAKKVARDFLEFAVATGDRPLINIAENFGQYVATYKLPDIMYIVRQFLAYKE